MEARDEQVERDIDRDIRTLADTIERIASKLSVPKSNVSRMYLICQRLSTEMFNRMCACRAGKEK